MPAEDALDPLKGSTPWRLDRVSRDGQRLDLLVNVLRGPGIRTEKPVVSVEEDAVSVRIGVQITSRFPGPDLHYVASPDVVQVTLSGPLGERQLLAQPVDEHLGWLAPSPSEPVSDDMLPPWATEPDAQ